MSIKKRREAQAQREAAERQRRERAAEEWRTRERPDIHDLRRAFWARDDARDALRRGEGTAEDLDAAEAVIEQVSEAMGIADVARND